MADQNIDTSSAPAKPEVAPSASPEQPPAPAARTRPQHAAPLALTGQKTAALVPGSRLVVYEGAPHGLFVTHRERLSRDLLAFARS